MRRGKVILACAGLILISTLGALIWLSNNTANPSHSRLMAPLVTCERAESGSGVFGNDGAEMTLVTLCFLNPNNFGPENLLFITTKGIEARVSNHWIGTSHGWKREEGQLDCSVFPLTMSSKMILMPAGLDRCRVSLKYAGASVPFRAKLDHFLKNKLGRRQALLPARFWAWVQSHHTYSPKPPWKEIKIEVEIPAAAQGRR